MKESLVQKYVIKRMELNGFLVVKIIQCTKNGWPDLQCHKNGKTLFIECKSTGQKCSQLQLFRHEQLIKKGFRVLVVDSVDKVLI